MLERISKKEITPRLNEPQKQKNTSKFFRFPDDISIRLLESYCTSPQALYVQEYFRIYHMLHGASNTYRSSDCVYLIS